MKEIIHIDILDANELSDHEYDVINNMFKRKATKLGVIDKYLEDDNYWTIQCKIGE